VDVTFGRPYSVHRCKIANFWASLVSTAIISINLWIYWDLINVLIFVICIVYTKSSNSQFASIISDVHCTSMYYLHQTIALMQHFCVCATVVVRVDDKPIRLQLCDTAGQVNTFFLSEICCNSCIRCSSNSLCR